MKLNSEELAYLRSQGLYIIEKCDNCGKFLNQAIRYTSPGDPRVWCSRACQDVALGWDRARRHRQSSPRFHLARCEECGTRFRSRREDAQFCSQKCQKAAKRYGNNPVVRDNVQAPIAEAYK